MRQRSRAQLRRTAPSSTQYLQSSPTRPASRSSSSCPKASAGRGSMPAQNPLRYGAYHCPRQSPADICRSRYIGAEASTFERLALAGRMLKEVSSRCPGAIGLIALGDEAAAQGSLDALLAAALASAFQMPAFRSREHEDMPSSAWSCWTGRKLIFRTPVQPPGATTRAMADGASAEHARHAGLSCHHRQTGEGP